MSTPGDPYRRVAPGQPLQLPSQAWNALMEMLTDQRTGAGAGTGGSRVRPVEALARNEGEDPVLVGEALMVTGVVNAPAGDAASPQSLPPAATVLAVDTFDDAPEPAVAIATTAMREGVIGRCAVAGVVWARVRIAEEGDEELGYAAPEEGERTLRMASTGPVRVLWLGEPPEPPDPEGDPPEPAIVWALVSLNPESRGRVFPVHLTQVGGAAGGFDGPATWTYDVRDREDGALLDEGVNPAEKPHTWRRPAFGAMLAATAGHAHLNESGELVIGWINETPQQSPCEDEEEEPETTP